MLKNIRRKEEMNTTREQIAWEKTSNQVEATDGKTYAWSPEGAWICWEDYGNINSIYGWEIDHWNGNAYDNHQLNLRAMQWQNNRSKGDSKNFYIRKVYAPNNSIANNYGDTRMRLTNSPNKDAVA